jgi:ABC-type sugar transport system ATPase subunit
VQFASPRDALAAGVGMVHQELAFCENLSVAENLCLGSLPSRAGLLDRDAMAERARAMLAENRDGARRVAARGLAHHRAAADGADRDGGERWRRIIIFDEPTSSLSQDRGRSPLRADRTTARARGVACIYVSHRMPEVFRLCETVSVLRDGQHVGTRPIAGLSEHELVRMMIGRPLAEYVSPPNAVPGDEVLRVTGTVITGEVR